MICDNASNTTNTDAHMRMKANPNELRIYGNGASRTWRVGNEGNPPQDGDMPWMLLCVVILTGDHLELVRANARAGNGR